jgi:hypothetical protein
MNNIGLYYLPAPFMGNNNNSDERDKQMTKTELVEEMAKDAGISKGAATKALNSMIDGITKSGHVLNQSKLT